MRMMGVVDMLGAVDNVEWGVREDLEIEEWGYV
jgi:hypothetical protein